MIFKIKVKDKYVEDFDIEKEYVKLTNKKLDAPLFSIDLKKDYVKLRDLIINKGYKIDEIEMKPVI